MLPTLPAAAHLVEPLCTEVALALHIAGTPAHRLEAAVDRVRRSYGQPGSTVATPTALWLQVGERARVVRLPPADVDLDKMGAVLRWVERLTERPVPVPTARRALDRLRRRPEPWPRRLEQLAFIATSAAAAVLLGGGAMDVLMASVAGAVALAFLGRVSPASAWRPLRDALLATLLGAVSALGGALGASPSVVALSGAILIVPGLSMTTALAELAAGHWTAGGSRLLGTALVLAQLAAGLAVGWWAVGPLPVLVPPVPLPPAVVQLVPLLAPVGFAVLLRSRPRDLPVAWLTAVMGWSTTTAVGGLPGAALGGLAVAVVAGTMGRLARVPDLALVVPGILLLVPGTVGVLGVEQLLDHAVVDGAATALRALETAGALAAGVFAGQAFVDAGRRALRGPGALSPASEPPTTR